MGSTAPVLEVVRRTPADEGVADRGWPPILFVHGAWHAAWCWQEHFLSFFAGRGFEAHALSLRGHGASHGAGRLRWTRLGEFVTDVARVARDLPRPPIVIGHSMGGFVVQHYLAHGHPAAGAVLVCAVPPGVGVWPAAARSARRHPIAFLRINLLLSLYQLVRTPELAHDMLFSAQTPASLVRTYFPRLQDESFVAFAPMFLKLPDTNAVVRRGLPMLVLGADEDRIIGASDVRRTARTYRAEMEIFAGMGHDVMVEPNWTSVAERIQTWVENGRW